jgi:2-polyprenyl-6-methoxyphenol hydroxylase-like FAD-dependent oxidoreductase
MEQPMDPRDPSPRTDADVLIVGAGPTGLTLAAALERAGVSTLIVDKLDSGQNTSRAAVIHAHTLEVLEAIGVADQLTSSGLKLTRFSLRDRDDTLVRLRFDELPSKYPHLLMITQDVTERILRDSLAATRRRVRWGCRVEKIVDLGDHICATFETEAGREVVCAKYVVGADGMHSLVRKTAGIGFIGESYEDSFVLADVDMDWDHGRDEVMLFFSPTGVLVVAPLPGGRFRIVGSLENAPEKPGVADVQALLDARGPTEGAARISCVHWSSRFRLHHRVAERYRNGRLLLVGDAAHAHSPAGGQGMNTGLVDACVLAELLADVMYGRRAEAALDQYERLRKPAAEQVLGLAGRLTGMAMARGATRRLARNTLLRILGRLPPARRRLQMQLSGLARRAASQVPAIN